MICTLDRYLIGDLAVRLKSHVPGLSISEIEDILRKDVNLSEDKLLLEHRSGEYSKENSISAFEAHSFIADMIARGHFEESSPRAETGRGLAAFFFDGDIFNLPEFKKIKITKCHDGDTCTIEEYSSDGCNTPVGTVNVRISGIDAPEVGYYDEQLADGVRGRKSPYAAPPASARPRNGWINGKLVENVDKVHVELARGNWNPKALSYRDRAAINALIAATIDYTGQLSGLVRNDLTGWETDSSVRGAELLVESQIRWTSDDTPKALCESWQLSDKYMRRLGSFAQIDNNRLSRYISSRLAKVMAENGDAIHKKYQEKVAKHLAVLNRTRTPGLKEIAQSIVNEAPKPAIICSRNQCEKMAEEFARLRQIFPSMGGDDQAMAIITGTAYDYMKYRNQYGEEYAVAGKISRAAGFGLWQDKTFRTLWEVNARNRRYSPEDCRVES